MGGTNGTVFLKHYTTAAHKIALFHHFHMVLDEMTFRNHITVNLYDIISRCLRYRFVEDDRSSETVVLMPYMNDRHRELLTNAIYILFGILTGAVIGNYNLVR